MKKTPLFLILGLSGAGLLSGIAARRLMYPTVLPVVENKPAVVREAPEQSAPAILPSRSADTLEALAALPHSELYSRLAAWLVDAGEPEIATFWDGYRTGKRTNEITNLVFIHWTRLNPQAAIATVAGTPDEHYAWWAWSCHDPQGSLAAGLAAGPERVKNVAYGLGEFHPAWLRQHFSEIPEAARKDAFSGLAKWGDAQNPLEMLKFAEEHGMNSGNPTFRALVSKDPWAALDWAKENRTGLDELISQMAEESPDDLARLAGQSPSGEAKRKMEAALFANLLKTDLEAAIAQAKAAEVPRVAAERCSAVGLALVKTDPEQAFEMAEHLLAACPNAMMAMNSIQIPGGGNAGGWGTAVDGVTELMDALLFQDPAKLIDIVTARPSDDDDYPFDNLSDQWIQRDLAAYAEWVKRQTDPAIRNDGTNKVVSQLQKDGLFQDAVDWAMSLTGDNRMNKVENVTINWAQKDRGKALEWLEAADLPAEDKSALRNRIAP